jgi:hypothetical protein
MKHTPAPWNPRIIRDEEGIVQMAFVSAKDVNGFSYDAEILGEDEYREDVERQIADVYLVASAPELLEALKNLLAVMEGEGGTKTNAQETARQAIAKAEGA